MEPSCSDPVVILGAGPAGLGAGLALGTQGVVLEGAAHLGGLCRSLELDGAVFDLGGHSFHTPHPEIRELVFQALPMFEQPRNAWCFAHGEYLPYPFQKHFEQLQNADVREECRRSLPPARAPSQPARHFAEQLERRFGAGLVRHFLRPYNEKFWGGSLERLAADWTAERVPGPAGMAERFACSGGQRTPLQDDTSVAYPARGAFGEIFRALARQLPQLRLGETVVRIEPRHRTAHTACGTVYPWRRLVSTLPLPQLLSLLPDVPAQLTEAAEQLEVLPLALVLVVVGHAVATPVQRVYCPGPELPAHKVVLNHNSSPYLRALPQHGILAEVSNPVPQPAAELVRQVVAGLQALDLLRSPTVVRATQVVHLPAAYPVPTHARAALVEQLKQWLEEQGIHTVGRFGDWAYINSDEALLRGLRLGQSLAAAT